MQPPPLTTDTAEVPGTRELTAWIAGLADTGITDTERVGRLRLLEDLKAMAAAAQARLSVDLDASVRADHADLGLPATQQGRGVASQVALARRVSPARGSRDLGLAKALVDELPHTLAALEAGWCSEWRATIVARETACLSREHRGDIDRALMADPTTTHGWGDRRLGAEAAKRAYALDPHAVVRRTAKAEAERRVTSRPAPDTMCQVTALLPAAQGIAVWATLTRVADQAIAGGDGRTRGQVMADTLVERVTSHTVAADVPVSVNLTVSDETLLDAGTQPPWLAGYGPVPAGVARDLVARAVADGFATLRRLYVQPDTGHLVGMDSRATAFPHALGLFIDLRDQTCRTSWCDAPVRHHDHVRSLLAGGPTTAVNGQGLCEQCNYAKQAPRWTARPATGPPDPVGHHVETTTPTGHRHLSRAPDQPRPTPHVTIVRPEDLLLQLVLTA